MCFAIAQSTIPARRADARRESSRPNLVFLAETKIPAHSPGVPEDVAVTPKELMQAVEAGNREAILSLAAQLHYADLAQVYEDIEPEQRELFLETIGPKLAADVIGEMPDSLIEEALDTFKDEELKILFRELSDDDRVDVLQDVDDDDRHRFLDLLGPEDEKLTRSLLKYGEDTAGGRMTTKIGRLCESMTVKEAFETLRRDQDSIETLSRIFVVDKEDRLRGKVRLRDLAFGDWDTPVSEIMTEVPPEQRALATTDQEEAANTLVKYDLVVVPVVDEFDHLLGVITYDDAMEILQEESTEDIEKLAGISGEQSEESYLNTGVLANFRRRFVWLLGLAFVSIISGYVMMHFGTVLTTVFTLSLFLPMVVAAGGNTGGQASTMVIRAMALGELEKGNLLRVAWKELRLGAMLGLTMGGCMALFILFVLPAFRPDMPGSVTFAKMAMVVASALTAQITSSTFLGSILPLGARTINLDPAVVSAPAIAAIVDVSGMVIYFTVARTLLGL
jgi:magnesium transporter